MMRNGHFIFFTVHAYLHPHILEKKKKATALECERDLNLYSNETRQVQINTRDPLFSALGEY